VIKRGSIGLKVSMNPMMETRNVQPVIVAHGSIGILEQQLEMQMLETGGDLDGT
jgi:hypothetical protein